MKLRDYINDKKTVLLTCAAGTLFFSALLVLFGINAAELTLLWICFIIIIFFAFFSGFFIQRKRIGYLLSALDSLDKKYLIAEVIDKPENRLEQVYFQFLKIALKSMTDEVAQSQRISTEYREFIEQWVHEIKVPITGIKLVCENNKTDITRKLITQVELIEKDVERVLFYARIGNVEKDYFIKKVSLRDCVEEALAQNKQFLIQSGVCVHSADISNDVYSDHNWICFILNQIIFNSIKYRSKHPPILEIESHDMENYVFLSIKDNGVGIKKSELNRVFDKGFVGSNGRSGKNATGMGLYLCEQFCIKLGISIDIKSEVNQYTNVILYFPKRDYQKFD